METLPPNIRNLPTYKVPSELFVCTPIMLILLVVSAITITITWIYRSCKHIHNYSFFAYHVNESLHMSEQERGVIVECFRKIEMELKQSIDKHSKKLIVSNIELLLDYCVRFYDRQFITRDHAHSDLLENFESLLHEYLHSALPQETGIPSVSYFAEKLHLSTNYFSDLLRKETGRSAKDYINEKLIDVAKEKIYQPGKSVSEIAYELGFKYPQHFTRFFKQHVGQTPNEYRSLN
jgi:AraC-like DNA-binding protein